MADSYRRLPDEERFQTGVFLVAFFFLGVFLFSFTINSITKKPESSDFWEFCARIWL